jgi:hypothetical protein
MKQDLIDAIATMDQAARALAAAFQRFNAGAAVARRAAFATSRGERALTEVSTTLSTLPGDLAAHLAALGLAHVCADAEVARRAAGAPDTTDTFVARWTAKIQHLVP